MISLFINYITDTEKYRHFSQHNILNIPKKIIFSLFFISSAFIGTAKAQDVNGTVVNYNEDPAVPISGIEVYFDSAFQDTTNSQGVFGFPTTIVRDETPILPTEFTLSLFPNPFNPSTILEYSVPLSGNISIIGYNTLGQIIYSEKLDNQTVGIYKLMFEADTYNLASQVLYFQVVLDPKDERKASLVKVIKGVYIR